MLQLLYKVINILYINVMLHPSSLDLRSRQTMKHLPYRCLNKVRSNHIDSNPVVYLFIYWLKFKDILQSCSFVLQEHSLEMWELRWTNLQYLESTIRPTCFILPRTWHILQRAQQHVRWDWLRWTGRAGDESALETPDRPNNFWVSSSILNVQMCFQQFQIVQNIP